MTMNFSWWACKLLTFELLLRVCVGVLAYPVEGHISTIFKDVVVGMAQNSDVAVSRSALGTKLMQGMLGMRRIASQSLINLKSTY